LIIFIIGISKYSLQESGPRLFECSPSGNYFDYHAVSIGSRSQSAKTYLEKHFASFEGASLDELIVHGVRSLRDTIQDDKSISIENLTVGFVGENEKFTIVEGPALQRYRVNLQ
jgi:20S proteasome subunit alpha 6